MRRVQIWEESDCFFGGGYMSVNRSTADHREKYRFEKSDECPLWRYMSETV